MKEDALKRINTASKKPKDTDEHVIQKEIPVRTSTEEPRRFKTYKYKKDPEETIHIRTGKKPEEHAIVQRLSDDYGLIQNGIQISTDTPPVMRSGKERKLERVSPRKLEAVYATDGMVSNWINRIVEFFLSAEPSIEGKTPTDQKKLDEFLKNVNMRELIKLNFQHKYTYGNAVWRWTYTDDYELKGINFIDPKYFDALRDARGRIKLNRDGEPKAYVQYLKQGAITENIPEERIVNLSTGQFEYQSGTAVLFLPKEIMHFRLNRIGDSWWGLGQIEPMYNHVINKKNADIGYAETLQRIGYPRIVGYVGDENHPPTTQQVDDVWDDLGDLSEKSQLVVPHYVNFEVLEPKANNKSTNLEYFINNMVTGLGGPKSLVTGAGESTNRATLSDQKMWLERGLNMEQEDTSIQIREKVLTPLAKELGLSEVPELTWKETSMDSLESKINRIVALVKSGILTPGDELEKYVRELEDLPVIGEK